MIGVFWARLVRFWVDLFPASGGSISMDTADGYVRMIIKPSRIGKWTIVDLDRDNAGKLSELLKRFAETGEL